MKTALMFSRQTDEWATPQDLFDALDAEFGFELDAAASVENTKHARFIGAFTDALAQPSWGGLRVWLNPPYSKCREFIAKAAQEARKGCTVVCLVPSRTDTRWWHEHVWEGNQPQPGVEVRFIKGRLKFGDSTNSAPFPSVVIVFRPVVEVRTSGDAVDPVSRDTTDRPRATDLLPFAESA